MVIKPSPPMVTSANSSRRIRNMNSEFPRRARRFQGSTIAARSRTTP